MSCCFGGLGGKERAQAKEEAARKARESKAAANEIKRLAHLEKSERREKRLAKRNMSVNDQPETFSTTYRFSSDDAPYKKFDAEREANSVDVVAELEKDRARAAAGRLARQRAEDERWRREEEEREERAKERAIREAERRAKEEADRQARVEEEHRVRALNERLAQDRTDREAERKAREVADRKAREEAERRRRDEDEERARALSERLGQEKAQRDAEFNARWAKEQAILEAKLKEDAARAPADNMRVTGTRSLHAEATPRQAKPALNADREARQLAFLRAKEDAHRKKLADK